MPEVFGKIPVVKERLTMVIMIGRMVDGTCFKWKKLEWNRDRIDYLEIASIIVEGKDVKTAGLRGGLK